MELTEAVQNAIDVDLLRLSGKGLLVDGGTTPSNPGAATPAATFLSDVYGAVDGVLLARLSTRTSSSSALRPTATWVA